MDSEMRTFVQIAQRGSFSAAADDLGLTPSAVSKLVARLEDRLGVRLLHRTTRRLALTAEGEIYVRRARDILDAITDAEAEISCAGEPRGLLRVNCAIGFGLHALAPVLPEFMTRYPDIIVEMSVTDRMVDLIAEKADAGIRSGEVTDQSLVARRVGRFERRLYASPLYLLRRGAPQTPEQLAEHDCILQGRVQSLRWTYMRDGRLGDVEMRGRIVVDDSEAALRLACAGAGIARFADVLVDEAIREGKLVPILTEFQPPEQIDISVVYPYGRHRMPKIRALVDFLAEKFSDSPWQRPVPHPAVAGP